MTITPYALMMDDPTTEAMVCWIDTRPGGTDAPQTLRYGPQAAEVASSVVELPGGGRFVHHAHITGQQPGTLCPVSLPAEGATLPPVKMLPRRVPSDGLVGLSVSDMHCGRRQINTPAKFAFIGAERPDFIIMAGDSSAELHFAENDANSTRHVATFRDYFTQWWADGAFLPQMLCDGGNHWVSNTNGNGVSISNAITGAGYFDWFHPNMRLLPPVSDPLGNPVITNCRHAMVRIGNWLQLISGDVYSNTVASAAAAFLELHDADPALCIFMAHSPFFSQGQRTAGDPVIQANLRNALFKAIAQRENCLFTFGGNIHLDTITKPLAWYDSDPGAPSVALSDGWAAPAGPGEWRTFIEFGEGCIGGRPLQAEPLVPSEMWDYFEVAPLNYYLMRFTPGRVVVEDKDETGVRSAREFLLPFAERADGRVARAYAADGRPVRWQPA